MWVCCILDEAIQQYYHLIALILILAHYLQKLIHAILKEKDLGLQRITVEQLIADLGQSVYHQLEALGAKANIIMREV